MEPLHDSSVVLGGVASSLVPRAVLAPVSPPRACRPAPCSVDPPRGDAVAPAVTAGCGRPAARQASPTGPRAPGSVSLPGQLAGLVLCMPAVGWLGNDLEDTPPHTPWLCDSVTELWEQSLVPRNTDSASSHLSMVTPFPTFPTRHPEGPDSLIPANLEDNEEFQTPQASGSGPNKPPDTPDCARLGTKPLRGSHLSFAAVAPSCEDFGSSWLKESWSPTCLSPRGNRYLRWISCL